MQNLLLLTFFFLGAMTVYRFRAPILDALRRFDARNAQRAAEQHAERRDRFAHYRHTIQLTAEQVEQVQEMTDRDERLGIPVNRYVFLGEKYATREEAEAARGAEIFRRARGFYNDLDRMELGRRRAPFTPPRP
jgi:hypothetical protein